MELVAQVVITSIIWGPALVILYWIIRLAVRHGVEDAQETERTFRRRAAARVAAAQQEAARGGGSERG